MSKYSYVDSLTTEQLFAECSDQEKSQELLDSIERAINQTSNINTDEEVDQIQMVLLMCRRFIQRNPETIEADTTFTCNPSRLIRSADFLRSYDDIVAFADGAAVTGAEKDRRGRYMLVVDTDYDEYEPYRDIRDQ